MSRGVVKKDFMFQIPFLPCQGSGCLRREDHAASAAGVTNLRMERARVILPMESRFNSVVFPSRMLPKIFELQEGTRAKVKRSASGKQHANA